MLKINLITLQNVPFIVGYFYINIYFQIMILNMHHYFMTRIKRQLTNYNNKYNFNTFDIIYDM